MPGNMPRIPHSDPVADPVDAVLTSLRNAPIPVGLEQRVLRNIELRQAEAAVRPNRFRLWLIPALTTLAALLVIAVIQLRHRKPIATAAIIPTQPAALPPASGKPAPLQPRNPLLAHNRVLLAADHPRPTVSLAAQPQPDPLEEDHPAPELPLTRQERLLIRIAYGAQPQQQLALLHRNGMRLRPPADDDFDFNAFFEPYTTPLTQTPAGDPQ